MGKVLHEEIQQDQTRRHHIPIIFVTGLFDQIFVKIRANPWAGLSSIDKTTYCKLLSNEFDALYLSLDDILAQKAADPTDPHADFAALYLQKGLDTSPIGYMTDLLKENIDGGIKQGKCCVIIDGFPRSIKQLRGFEDSVRMGDICIWPRLLSNRFKKEILHYFLPLLRLFEKRKRPTM